MTHRHTVYEQQLWPHWLKLFETEPEHHSDRAPPQLLFEIDEAADGIPNGDPIPEMLRASGAVSDSQ